MARKKQAKKRNKKMSSGSAQNQAFETVKPTAPKNTFGGSLNTSGNTNAASMRSPGSQRKR